MPTIRDTLKRFLAETGQGSPRSMSSPASIIELFGTYLDGYGHEDLNEFDLARFEKEHDQGQQFCEIFGPDHIQPFHINFFLSFFVIRKVMGSKGFLKACGPVMEKLATWLLEQRYWTSDDMAEFRDLVGEKAGADLGDCDALGRALLDHMENHPVDVHPNDVADEDYLEDQFTIQKVEAGKLHFDSLLEEGEGIALSLPRSVTAKARTGWSVTLELARLRGKWRILGVGSVYP